MTQLKEKGKTNSAAIARVLMVLFIGLILSFYTLYTNKTDKGYKEITIQLGQINGAIYSGR